MTLEEGYNIVNGVYKKNNSDLKYYTDIETFHKIVKSGYIEAQYYPANTYTYGKGEPKKGFDKEVCFVRSDRTPDTQGGFELSHDIGDINFCFSKQTLESAFGKVKPIDEYPVQAIHFLKENLIPTLKNNINSWWKTYRYNDVIKKIDDLKKYLTMSNEEKKKIISELTKNNSIDGKIYPPMLNKFGIDEINNKKYGIPYVESQYNNREKMESRVRTKDKNLSIKYADRVLIPDYLKTDAKILLDVQKLKKQNIPVDFYKCKFPREKEKYIDKLSKK